MAGNTMRIIPKFGELTRMTVHGQILERDVPVDVPREVGETLIRQGTAWIADADEADRIRSDDAAVEQSDGVAPEPPDAGG